MDMTSLDRLSPEEISALERAISARKQAADDPVSILAMVLEAALADIKAMREDLEKVKSDFYEKVLGGIDDLYKEGLRADGMKSFGEKYGSMFSPFADDFKRVFDGDLIEKAFDYLESLRGEEGYTDESGDAKLKELVGQLKGKFAKPDAAVAVEVSKAEPEAKPAVPASSKEPEPEDDPEFEAMEKEVARMKARDRARKSS